MHGNIIKENYIIKWYRKHIAIKKKKKKNMYPLWITKACIFMNS